MISPRRLSIGPRLVVSAGAGAMAAAGLAPLGAWWATLLGLAALAALFPAGSAKASASLGWAFATGYFACGLVWIVEPFLVDPERHGWMAPFALVFLAAGLALFWALAFFAAHRMACDPSGQARGRQFASLLVTISMAELARGYVLTGFPWAGLAQIWVDTPVILWLRLVGPQGLAALTLSTAFLTALPFVSGRPSVRTVILAAMPIALLWGGALIMQSAGPAVPETTATVRLVQPNAPQDKKWHPGHAAEFFTRQIGFTRADANPAPRPDLIVWPETAVPMLLNEADVALAAMGDAAAGVPLVFGIQRSDGLKYYNSLAVLGPDGQVDQVYDKHHLVPFGEYFPLGDLAARFGLHGFAAQEGDAYSAGPGPRLLDLGALGQALPLICYEAVFAQDVLGAPHRPDLLLQITNDAWFGNNSGPRQHLAQARMRAVEQGVPLARAANTGISAMIDPLGRVTQSLELGQAGYVDAVLPAPLSAPLYARIGDLPVFLALIVAGLWLRITPRRPHGAFSD